MKVLNNRLETIATFSASVSDKDLFIRRFGQFMSAIEIDGIKNMNDYSKIAKSIGVRINEGTAALITGDSEPVSIDAAAIRTRLSAVVVNFNEHLVYMHSGIYDPLAVAKNIELKLKGLKVTLTPNQFAADTTVVAIKEMISFMKTPTSVGFIDSLDSRADKYAMQLDSINDKLQHLSQIAEYMSYVVEPTEDTLVSNEGGSIDNLVAAMSAYRFNNDLHDMLYRIESFENIMSACDIALSLVIENAKIGKLANMTPSERELLCSLCDSINSVKRNAIKTRDIVHNAVISEIRANEQLTSMFDKQEA